MSEPMNVAELDTIIDTLKSIKKQLTENNETNCFDYHKFRNGQLAVICKSESDSDIFLAYLIGKGILTNIKNWNWSRFHEETCYSYSGGLICDSRRNLNYRHLELIEFNKAML